MAAKYDWGDGLGKVHTISLAQHRADVSAKTKTAKGTPIVPAGSYDPALDAQLYSTQRGLTDLVGLAPDSAKGVYGGDIGKALQRGSDDFITNTGQLSQDYGTNVARTNQTADRSLSDLLTSRARGDEDYKTNTATVQRNYQNLGTAQSGAARKAGALATGGAFAQAAEKRAANQALDQAPIDTAYHRALDDSQSAQTRLEQDRSSQLSDLLTNYQRGTGQLGLTQDRSIEDLGTQATRAIREASAGGQDIQAAKVAQFQQMYPGASLPTAKVAATKLTPQQQSAAQRAAALKARKAALTKARAA